MKAMFSFLCRSVLTISYDPSRILPSFIFALLLQLAAHRCVCRAPQFSCIWYLLLSVLGLFVLLWEPAQPFYHMCKSGMRGSNHLWGWDSGDKSSGFSISGRHFQSPLPGPQQDWVPIIHSYSQHNNPGLGFSPALFAFSVLHSLESCPQINYHTQTLVSGSACKQSH